jgi:hypothetical protein
VLFGKGKHFLSSFIFLIIVEQLKIFHALLDLSARLLLIGIIEVDNPVELNSMALQFLDVLLILREADQDESANKWSFTRYFIDFKD